MRKNFLHYDYLSKSPNERSVNLVVYLDEYQQIYNANSVLGGREGWHFPDFLLLGGWLAGGRNWHFAAM